MHEANDFGSYSVGEQNVGINIARKLTSVLITGGISSLDNSRTSSRESSVCVRSTNYSRKAGDGVLKIRRVRCRLQVVDIACNGGSQQMARELFRPGASPFGRAACTASASAAARKLPFAWLTPPWRAAVSATPRLEWLPHLPFAAKPPAARATRA